MSNETVRTTLALAADLLAAVDCAVREGRARSRNEFMTVAIQHELAAQRRAAIDAAFEGMGQDPDYLADVEQLDQEFARAEWEAFQLAEREYAGRDHAAR